MMFLMQVFSEGRQHSHIPLIGSDTEENKLDAGKRAVECDRRHSNPGLSKRVPFCIVCVVCSVKGVLQFGGYTHIQ